MRCIFIFILLSLFMNPFFINPAECRMYDPKTGRFLQRDPVGYFDHMNLYQYVHNQPINYTDPYGLLNPEGGCVGWVCAYTKKDYEEGKQKLKEGMKEKYPWMNDNDLDEMADKIMREMKWPEGQELKDLEKKNDLGGAEELIKKICERTGANCNPEKPNENEACETKKQ